jgi:hypothetical protein
MKIKKNIWQALTIIVVGNFNFLFINLCMDEVDLKGILPFIIFLPYFFTIAGINLLLNDPFYAKVKKLTNKVIRITSLIILILFSIVIAILLQTTIYYIIMESWTKWC